MTAYCMRYKETQSRKLSLEEKHQLQLLIKLLIVVRLRKEKYFLFPALLVSPDYYWYYVICLMDCFIITDQPEITAHPRNETKTEGENVILSCNATGNPVPTISWNRNGSPIDTSGNSSRISFSADKKQLTITNVNRTDSGEYRCVANNSVGIGTSNPATLDVICKYSTCCCCYLNIIVSIIFQQRQNHSLLSVLLSISSYSRHMTHKGPQC